MIRNLIPWNQLTRAGIPPLKVARRPLVFGEVSIPVGATLDPELLPMQVRRERLRQFYEQRRLEPVDAPPDAVQFYREQQIARMQMGQEIPIAPIQPVAARIVADLPATEVPELPDPPRRPKGAK